MSKCTTVHVVVDATSVNKPMQPCIHLIINSGEMNLNPKPLAGGDNGLYVATIRLPTCAEVALAQLSVTQSTVGPGDGVNTTEDHVLHDTRSYAFSLLFNAVIYIKWDSHFAKYNLAHGFHSFILSSYPEVYKPIRVIGSSPDLGRWNVKKIQAKTMTLKKGLSLTAVIPLGEELDFNLICGTDKAITKENLDQPKSLFSPLRDDLFIFNTWSQGNIAFTFAEHFTYGSAREAKAHIAFRISDSIKTSVDHVTISKRYTSSKRNVPKSMLSKGKAPDSLSSGEGQVDKSEASTDEQHASGKEQSKRTKEKNKDKKVAFKERELSPMTRYETCMADIKTTDDTGKVTEAESQQEKADIEENVKSTRDQKLKDNPVEIIDKYESESKEEHASKEEKTAVTKKHGKFCSTKNIFRNIRAKKNKKK